MNTNLQEMMNSFQLKTSELSEAHVEMKELLETFSNFFQNQKQDYDKIQEMVKKLNYGDSDIIKFNVGGKIFSTYISTLTKKIPKMENPDEFYEPHLLEGNLSLN